MKKILVTIVVALAGIFLVSILGSVMLEQFPALQPMWDEFKTVSSELYQSSLAKYGTIATIAIIICIFILIGSSK